ncbi:hypothetical protein BDM02DRAFT_2511034 [Thelephora ganbajun]|uniref:Uncharacterized protein n=1 Tax=Thelephora ganbajun TaxID=370292 RepID=A0ACB6YYN4_THEGA|nr:hypothetical protein BDM02DRAFT_2511034 [Thelephora ganbajun]
MSILRKRPEQDAGSFARIVRGSPSSRDSSMTASRCPCFIRSTVWSPRSTRFIVIPQKAQPDHIFFQDGRLPTCCEHSNQLIASWDPRTGVGQRTIQTEQITPPTKTHFYHVFYACIHIRSTRRPLTPFGLTEDLLDLPLSDNGPSPSGNSSPHQERGRIPFHSGRPRSYRVCLVSTFPSARLR